MESTNSTEQTPWQKSREALDRIEAAGLLDEAPFVMVSIFGSGGLGIHLGDRAHAEAIAARYKLGEPTISPNGDSVGLRWSGVADGVRLDVYGRVPIDISAYLVAGAAVTS